MNTNQLSLPKTLQDLEAHVSSLSSFTLQWKDLEQFCASIQRSIEERLHDLESKEKQQPITQQSPLPGKHFPEKQPLPPKVLAKNTSGSVANLDSELEQPLPTKVLAVNTSGSVPDSYPELKSLCINMDGKGLLKYLIEHCKEHDSILVELPGAIVLSSDPCKLVLDAIEGSYAPYLKGHKDTELGPVRRTCVLLLGQLIEVCPKIEPHVKEKAMELAVEWKRKICHGGKSHLEVVAFLQLLATYGLASAFNEDELIDLICGIAHRQQTVDLCRVLGLAEKVPDLIENILSKGKQFQAIKFISEFDLEDKFPPVPLLKAYVNDCKMTTQKICEENSSLKSQLEATAREIGQLKAAMKCIEGHKLESQYPLKNLRKRIAQLEKAKAEKKRLAAAPATEPKERQLQKTGNKQPRPAAAPPTKPEEQQPQKTGIKRPRPAAAPRNVVGLTSTVHPMQEFHHQPAGLFPDQLDPFLNTSVGPYDSADPTPNVSPYMSSSAGLYGSARAMMGFAGNPSPTRTRVYSSSGSLRSSDYFGRPTATATGFAGNLYPTGSHLPSSSESLGTLGYYDRPTAYGDYGLPHQYRPSWYRL